MGVLVGITKGHANFIVINLFTFITLYHLTLPSDINPFSGCTGYVIWMTKTTNDTILELMLDRDVLPLS